MQSDVVAVGVESPAGLDFAIEVDPASADLAFTDDRTDALLTIRSSAATPGAFGTRTAEVLIMDESLSMDEHGKLDEAKRAMCAAVDALRDGSYLGIVAGSHEAHVIFPPTGGLARVDAAARADAKQRIAARLPNGGTRIGTWLTRADGLFSAGMSPGVVRHAVLYTDGRDEHERPEELADVLAACADRFVCDARGLGDDWNYTELLRITEALHGTADAVDSVSDLTRDFVALMEHAQGLVVPRVYLGLRLNTRFRLGFVKQTLPVEADLTRQAQQFGTAEGEEIHVPLGSWAPDTVRQYLVSLRFAPEALGVDQPMRATRVTLRAERPDGTRQPCAERKALVVQRRSTPGFVITRSPGLTRVENERELGMAMRGCFSAWEQQDLDRADRELRTALDLAESLQDTARLRFLRTVAVRTAGGAWQLRRDVPRGAMQRLGLHSTRTGPREADLVDLPVLADGTLRRRCPRGHVTTGRLVRHCEECGHVFHDVASPAPADGTPRDAAPHAHAVAAPPADGPRDALPHAEPRDAVPGDDPEDLL